MNLDAALQDDPILCPITLAVIRLADPESLMESIDLCKRQMDKLRSHVAMMEQSLLELASFDDDSTHRIRGKLYESKISPGSHKWDSHKLGQVHEKYPKESADCVKPSGWKCDKRKYDKLLKTDGPPEFEQFMALLQQAYEGRGKPSIKIDRIETDE